MGVIIIVDYFNTSSNEYTILVVNIEQGTIEIGMEFSIKEKNIKILGIEHIDGKVNDRWVSRIALKIKKVEKLCFFKNIKGKPINVLLPAGTTSTDEEE